MMSIKDLIKVIRNGYGDNLDVEVQQALYGYGLVSRESIKTLQGVKNEYN